VVYSIGQPSGSRVQSITLNGGTPILKNGAVYTMTLNSFTNGARRLHHDRRRNRNAADIDAIALFDYLKARAS